MPREMRKLLFNTSELETAATTHCRRHGIGAPDGAVRRLRVGVDPQAAISLRIGADEVHLSHRQVNEALIDYCQDTGIPIPRGAVKSVRAEAGGIAMMIEPGVPRRAA